jgi:hypothetical protein
MTGRILHEPEEGNSESRPFVERVRTWASIQSIGSDTTSVLSADAFDRCADEIERLQARLDMVMQTLGCGYCVQCRAMGLIGCLGHFPLVDQ